MFSLVRIFLIMRPIFEPRFGSKIEQFAKSLIIVHIFKGFFFFNKNIRLNWCYFHRWYCRFIYIYTHRYDVMVFTVSVCVINATNDKVSWRLYGGVPPLKQISHKTKYIFHANFIEENQAGENLRRLTRFYYYFSKFFLHVAKCQNHNSIRSSVYYTYKV